MNTLRISIDGATVCGVRERAVESGQPVALGHFSHGDTTVRSKKEDDDPSASRPVKTLQGAHEPNVRFLRK